MLNPIRARKDNPATPHGSIWDSKTPEEQI